MVHVMSLIFYHMSIGYMSHDDFKKRPCRPVKSKGQGPPDTDTWDEVLTYNDRGLGLTE